MLQAQTWQKHSGIISRQKCAVYRRENKTNKNLLFPVHIINLFVFPLVTHALQQVVVAVTGYVASKYPIINTHTPPQPHTRCFLLAAKTEQHNTSQQKKLNNQNIVVRANLRQKNLMVNFKLYYRQQAIKQNVHKHTHRLLNNSQC